jgi:diaminopimelate epimerase
VSVPSTFLKVTATGNDFIIFLDLENRFSPTEREVSGLCDRHFGIGADGLIRIGTTELDDFFMDYFNSDGSSAQMCGNGVRATAAALKHFGKTDDDSSILVDTRAGLKVVQRQHDVEHVGFSLFDANNFQKKIDVFRVNMGKWSADDGAKFEVRAGQFNYSARFVDMGNEHLVVEVPLQAELDKLDLSMPPLVSSDDSEFAERVKTAGTNVEFYYFHNGKLKLRIWERGVGETLSCGTGVCATAISNYLDRGLLHARVEVKGGVLDVDVHPDFVSLQGSAQVVSEFEYF